jgi:hypothetical protein
MYAGIICSVRDSEEGCLSAQKANQKEKASKMETIAIRKPLGKRTRQTESPETGKTELKMTADRANPGN